MFLTPSVMPSGTCQLESEKFESQLSGDLSDLTVGCRAPWLPGSNGLENLFVLKMFFFGRLLSKDCFL